MHLTAASRLPLLLGPDHLLPTPFLLPSSTSPELPLCQPNTAGPTGTLDCALSSHFCHPWEQNKNSHRLKYPNTNVSFRFDRRSIGCHTGHQNTGIYRNDDKQCYSSQWIVFVLWVLYYGRIWRPGYKESLIQANLQRRSWVAYILLWVRIFDLMDFYIIIPSFLFLKKSFHKIENYNN